MKNNELIAKLQAIKGNPDIVLWNGTVGDYQHIGNLVEGDLVKQTLQDYLERYRMEKCREEKDWKLQLTEEEISECKRYYKNFEYKQNNYVTKEDIQKGRYRRKRVFFIDAKVRGEVSYGRGGDVHY